MAKKRKKNRKLDVKLDFPVPLAIVLLIASTLALGYLTIVTRCEALGRDLRELETTLDEYQRRLSNEQYRWSQTIAPASLKAALSRNNLYMAWPQPNQVVRMDLAGEPPVSPDGADDNDVRIVRLARTSLNE